MRSTLICLALLLSLVTISRAQETIAFVNVNLIPMDTERVVPEQTVVIRGGRIVEIGSTAEVAVPEGAETIDGSGRYLMPGLAEMHGHIPPPDADAEFIEAVLFLYVANGITTVRGMLGWPKQLELREKANRSEIVSPTLYLAGPSFNGRSVGSPEEAVEKVRTQKAQGWNLIKVHPGLTRAEYDAMAETANEVGIRFGGHVPEEVGLLHALEMGQETFDHLDGYMVYLAGDQGPVEAVELEDAVRRTRDAGAWVVPTMALWETIWGVSDLETLIAYEELRYVPPDMVQEWSARHRQRLSNPDLDRAVARQVIDNRNRLLQALNTGGVRILMGTDAPQQFSVPGFSLHRELSVMASAGMTPYEIVLSGTRNVGDYFENEDDFGTIEVGKRADLLLVAENPLEDISNIASPSGVMVQGRWLSRAEIDRRLEELASQYASRPASR